MCALGLGLAVQTPFPRAKLEALGYPALASEDCLSLLWVPLPALWDVSDVQGHLRWHQAPVCRH